jgi:hypothetical protein
MTSDPLGAPQYSVAPRYCVRSSADASSGLRDSAAKRSRIRSSLTPSGASDLGIAPQTSQGSISEAAFPLDLIERSFDGNVVYSLNRHPAAGYRAVALD